MAEIDDKTVRMIDVHVLDKDSVNDPMFDLVPGKHGHILNHNGKIEEINGIRTTVPCLDINAESLFQIANFVDDMDGTVTHPDVTIIIKEANKEHNVPAKIGVFAI